MNRLSFRIVFLFISFYLCAEQGLHAQQIGLLGGLSLPDLRQIATANQADLSRQDFYYGIFAAFKLTNQLSLQAGLNYCGEGGKNEGIQPIPQGSLKDFPASDTFYANYTNTTILRYLEMPVLARLTWGKHMKYFIEGGIFAGYLLSAQALIKGSGSIYRDPSGNYPIFVPAGGTPFSPSLLNSNSNITNQVKTMNFGLVGGGGASYFAGRNQFFLDLRISEGMLNIYKDVQVNGKFKTGNVTLSLGYAFTL